MSSRPVNGLNTLRQLNIHRKGIMLLFYYGWPDSQSVGYISDHLMFMALDPTFLLFTHGFKNGLY
ncbi:hypothetical protein TUM3794_12740 [Shewanella colwelliana]|uniref:Uncharacterized protein n=1 Tax=Shewanella colwelliana TaxID=23 RepID=A0ABQ4NXA1_SHECO|nr:hypothetical protein TUM3794_12740 [Shewanella colwelliana]